MRVDTNLKRKIGTDIRWISHHKSLNEKNKDQEFVMKTKANEQIKCIDLNWSPLDLPNVLVEILGRCGHESFP